MHYTSTFFGNIRLDYANGLLHNLPQRLTRRMERVQRSAARIICRLDRRQRVSMTEVLHDLHWLPVTSRIQYKLLTLTFKALRTGTPKYLSDLLKPYRSGRHTRSQGPLAPDRLEKPAHKGVRMGGRSFSVTAPHLWNQLPGNIRNIKSIDTFKKQLKTYLFREHYYGSR